MANRLEAGSGRHRNGRPARPGGPACQSVPRSWFPLQDVTQLHADIGWFTGALAVALVIGLRFTDAPRRAARTSLIVLASWVLLTGSVRAGKRGECPFAHRAATPFADNVETPLTRPGARFPPCPRNQCPR
jgi:hypothetical protein